MKKDESSLISYFIAIDWLKSLLTIAITFIVIVWLAFGTLKTSKN